MDDKCFFIEDGVLVDYCGEDEDVVIPDNVITIGAYTFMYNKKIKSIYIPDSVKEIENDAFLGCVNLKKVTLSKDVKVSDSAFVGCTGLADDQGFAIINNVLYGYVGNASDVIVPEMVTEIGELAFNDCQNITSVVLPDGVTRIGDQAFGDCYSLTTINIPNEITAIARYMFSGCERLKSVTIPDGVMSIGEYAFIGCERLEKLVISATVIEIENGSLRGGHILEDSDNAVIHAPAGSYAESYAKENNIPFVAE